MADKEKKQRKGSPAYTNMAEVRLLLDAGLPRGTANMSYTPRSDGRQTWYEAEYVKPYNEYTRNKYIPCWSLSRLMDIIPVEYNLHLFRTEDGTKVYRLESFYRRSAPTKPTPIEAVVDFIDWSLRYDAGSGKIWIWNELPDVVFTEKSEETPTPKFQVGDCIYCKDDDEHGFATISNICLADGLYYFTDGTHMKISEQGEWEKCRNEEKD